MRGLQFRQVVILFSTAVCLFYLVYRALFTLNCSTPYAVFASVFLYVGEVYGVLCVLTFFLQIWDTYEPPEQPVLEGRTVDVFVPTYNEDPGILRATLEACQRMDYPHRTYLCDDGGTELRCNDKDETKAKNARERAALLKGICEELGCIYMTRPDNRHAKAGNLNYAFERTDGEFLIIFDADHVPEPHFIRRLIGYFRDEKLGFVQTPHAFYNFDSFQARHDHEKRVYWEEGHLFYNVIQPGRNRWGCPIFAGAAAMFRRKALEDVGYIATETITEDMHTGMRMQSKGWTSLGISERMIVGQAAPDITTFHTQRLRWGEGNLSIMAYDNPLTMRGLKFPQRMCYFGSMIHWAGGLFKLPIYLTPILMMFTGVPPVNEFTWSLAGLTALYMFVSIWGARVASHGYLSLLNGELFCMVNFWTQIRGTMRAIFWRKFSTFVVTAKRGRQSKSIWPFIRPQVYLAGLSVVGLLWGWSRFLFGISEDYSKPIIPSVWILFHLWLIVEVVRRALRPEDKRYSYRHAAALPVAYEYLGIEPEGGGPPVREVADPRMDAKAIGLTVDLSEGGLGMITYSRLPARAVLRLTLWARGEQLQCEGVVRWVRELSPGVAGTAQGYRCGIALRELTPKQLDCLNRMCLHYAVPRLYREYEDGHRQGRWQRVVAALARTLRPQRFAIRYPYQLPVVLEPANAPATRYYSVTEDVSRLSFSTLLPAPLAEGTELGVLIPTPMGDVRAQARLGRGERRRYAARDYQLAVLDLVHVEEQGRVTLESLINPRENRHLVPVIKPKREVLRAPMARPVAGFVAALLPLCLLSLATFRYLYRDDFFLRDLQAKATVPDAGETERFDRIYASTLAQGYATTDRLAMLMRLLTRMDRKEELSHVARLIAPRDRGNLDLQLALAQALDTTKDYERAEGEYNQLLARAQDGSLPLARRREMLVGAARSSVHAGRLDRATERFREVVRLDPENRPLRNEAAGVLLAASQPKEALALYQGIEPDFDDTLLLVAINARLENYDAAEAHVRRLLTFRPNDPQAEQLLADVLSWKKGYAQSRAILERLSRVRGNDPDLELRLAQVALWSKDYDSALVRFQALIDRGVDKPELLKGFVDAASSADKLGPAHKKTAVVLFDRLLTASNHDAVLLARLAWVLQRCEEPDKAAVLLDRAVALKPADPAIRKQLFGALVTAGRLAEALDGLDPERMDVETRRYLVSLHLKNKNFAAAAAECRRILKDVPDDLATERLLADVLSWNKQFKESLAVFDRLRRKLPDDAEIPLRIAEVTLWSGDYDKSVVLLLFQALLEKDFNQPAAQRGFIDAAARVENLTGPQLQLALRIYEGTRAGDAKDVPFLTRLAWVLHQAKQKDQPERLLTQALALNPQDSDARKELAGVLAALGKTEPALRLYRGVTLTVEDRYRLAGLLSAAKNYEAAAAECRAVLKEKPNDVRVRRLLADVLSWDHEYDESLALFEQLVGETPNDPALQLRLAEVALWGGHPDKALPGFRGLLAQSFEQPKLWPAFVDAAAGAVSLSEADGRLAAQIAEQVQAGGSEEVPLLLRLGWVLTRVGEAAKASRLLDRALALKPVEAALRKELAGVLAAAGRAKEGVALYDGLPLDHADRLRLAGLYAAARDFTTAEAQVRTALRAKPSDRPARRLLADVLGWGKKYAEAQAVLAQLLKEEPGDEGLRLRRAELTLNAGERDKALALYAELLRERFDRPAAQAGFVAAAAATEKLAAEHLEMAVRIADQAAPTTQNVPLLARLGWVLSRHVEAARAQLVLDRAVSLKSADAAAKRELAGVLAAVGRAKEAVSLYSGLTLTAEDHRHLAGLFSAANNFPEAERHCRLFLRDNPGDPEGRRLLADVLSWGGRYKEALDLFEQLIQEAPRDATLQLRRAEVTLWSADHPRALMRFEALLGAKFDQPAAWNGYVAAAVGVTTLTPAQLDLLKRVARQIEGTSTDVALLSRLAWVLHREKDSTAGRLLDRALALQPDAPALRRELAGVLGAAGRPKDALRLYQGLPLSVEDRLRLVDFHTAANNFEAAAAECRAVLEQQPNHARARRLLADVLSWNKQYKEARELFARLVQEDPRDDRLKVRLAEVTLWDGDCDAALVLFRGQLEREFNQPALWLSYANAAAGARALTEPDARLVRQIGERLNADETQDVIVLLRLAWVLTRVGDTARASGLLDRVLAQKPADAALSKELAGVLAAAGRAKQAVALYRALPLDAEDRLRLAGLYAAARDFPAAEAEVRAVLKDRPGDRKARRLLADVLGWGKKYAEALTVVNQLAQEEPGDEGLRLRRAELALGAGERDKALTLFGELLQERFDRPDAQAGYVAAAAAAEKLTAAQLDVVRRIAHQVTKDCADAGLLSRLAWVFHREGDRAKATTLLDQALALKPAEPLLRREVAGVLGAVGRHKEALPLYDGLPLLLEDRYRLAGLYSAVKDFAAAAEQCRAFLKEKPDDAGVRRLYADVLSWDRKYKDSLDLFVELIREQPANEDLQLRQAEVTLWSGDYDLALTRLQPFVEKKFDEPKLRTAYVDAASSAKQVNATHAPLALRIGARALADRTDNVPHLSRLAWVLFRLGNKDKATALLDRALALRPTEPAVRKELAGVLAAVGRRPQALELYRGLDLGATDRFRVAEMYAAESKLADAERELRAVLEKQPDDAKARRLLADVLLWSKNYTEARKLYQELQAAGADDPALPLRLAQLALWSGDYNDALERFTQLMAVDRELPEHWKGFTDAAASATKLAAAHRTIALQVYEVSRKVQPKDAVFYTRLGWVMRRLKEKEKSVELLKLALTIDPNARDTRAQLADALYDAGKFDEAEKHFSILLRGRPSAR
jgi:cellulose synthase/poly-beta-1,6-N-acetylglucosamine synthase-like glycosyltransferase/predicted Zn-dependent protease